MAAVTAAVSVSVSVPTSTSSSSIARTGLERATSPCAEIRSVSFQKIFLGGRLNNSDAAVLSARVRTVPLTNYRQYRSVKAQVTTEAAAPAATKVVKISKKK